MNIAISGQTTSLEERPREILEVLLVKTGTSLGNAIIVEWVAERSLVQSLLGLGHLLIRGLLIVRVVGRDGRHCWNR